MRVEVYVLAAVAVVLFVSLTFVSYRAALLNVVLWMLIGLIMLLIGRVFA